MFRVIWVYTIFAYFHTITSLYLLYIFSWTITGAAEILSNVDGEQVQRFSIRIDRVDPDAKNGRNLLITVTDEALLAKTGGIVQGMSGSPILQNGKLVGAVTHVLVNDPTMGYGVLIENMLEMAK